MHNRSSIMLSRAAALAIITTAALAITLATTSPANAGRRADKNTTGLPTYPQDKGGIMDAVMRSIPNGQRCTHYASDTTDPLAAVIEWYKKALPGAKVEDVNKDSLYGSYFKLDGVKLLVGNDIVNVYRGGLDSDGAKKTSIEIFKCQNAPQQAAD